jgi:hypothetical protein
MVTEDITNMKRLFNYKSQDTLGLVRGNARLENAAFSDVLAKNKKLLGESEDIEMKLPLKVSGMVLKMHQKLKNISKVLYQLIKKELKHQHLKKGEWDGIEICTRSD